MKIPEEWALELHTMGCSLPYPFKSYSSLSEHIKQIQLDAWKQGVQDANKEVKSFSSDSYHTNRIDPICQASSEGYNSAVKMIAEHLDNPEIIVSITPKELI